MTLAPPTTQATLSAIVTDATQRYFADRHTRVDPFVDRHFSVRGSLRLHRQGLGWDIVRSPVNLTMAAPNPADAGRLHRPAIGRLTRRAGAAGSQCAAAHGGGA